VIATLEETLKFVPPTDVFVDVPLLAIATAVTEEFERNTCDAAVEVILAVDVIEEPVILLLAATLRSVPPIAVFVAVELPVIAIAVTDEFDLNDCVLAVTVRTVAVATMFEVTVSCVPVMLTFAPARNTFAVNVELEATLTAAPENTALEVIARLAAEPVLPPRRAVSATRVFAVKPPYSLALR